MNKQMTPKQCIIFVLVIAITTFISMQVVYGQSDFTLEAEVVNSNNVDQLNNIDYLTITKFEIHGESYKQMCPSDQCTIGDYSYLGFSPPTPDMRALNYAAEFILEDSSNVTNSDIGPKEKEFLKQFTTAMIYCRVHDIIEDNGQEIYYCNGTNSIIRDFDSKTWSYDDSTVVYDAKNQTLKVNGNFTQSSIPSG